MSKLIKDKLGRNIYIKNNESIRYIISYYDETHNIKMIIKLIHKNEVFALYSRNGETIYESDKDFLINLNNIKIYNNKIKIKLPFVIRDEYLKILKQKNKK